MAAIDITWRRSWTRAPLLFLIGPGGAGKSSLARLLAPMLARRLVDLDDEFRAANGPIDHYMRGAGYEAYKRANSELAQRLAGHSPSSVLFVTSSGFLSPDNPPDILSSNRSLIRTGYSISLLPAADLDAASKIIVARQLSRGFLHDAEKERRTIAARFDLYRLAGDMLVVSSDRPEEIAANLASYLGT